MKDENRGIIRNRDAKRRLVTFSGLRWGKITPTDIDAIVEFKGKCFIVIEAKGDGCPVPLGQAIALERMLKQFNKGNSKGVIIICDVPDGDMEDDIDLGACITREIWEIRAGKICKHEINQTVKTVCDSFKEHCDV